jgi:hypothetical protein
MKLFVTRRSRSSGIVLPAARCVLPCQHVEASNNLSITPSLMREEGTPSLMREEGTPSFLVAARGAFLPRHPLVSRTGARVSSVGSCGRQTNSFIENSIEAGILLGGKLRHASLHRRARQTVAPGLRLLQRHGGGKHRRRTRQHATACSSTPSHAAASCCCHPLPSRVSSPINMQHQLQSPSPPAPWPAADPTPPTHPPTGTQAPAAATRY